MKRFAALLTALDHTTRTGAKVSAMADYLKTAPAADAAWAVYLLSGGRHRRVLTARDLLGACLRSTRWPEWLVEQSRAHVGDTAETVPLLVRSDRRIGEAPASEDAAAETPLDLPLHVWLDERLPLLRERDDEARSKRLRSWWRRVPEDQLYVLNKVITGSFRVGVSKRLVERALAAAADLPTDVITHRLIGDVTPTADAYERLTRRDTEDEVPPSRPYPFLLANPLPSPGELVDDPSAWRAEYKLDGIRGQLIRRRGETHLWSRGEDRITDTFPEIEAAAASLPDGTVLDGEVTAWGPEGPRLFGALQPRLGRKTVPAKLRREAPVRFVAYDLLESEGVDRRPEPLQERRTRLERILARATGDGADLGTDDEPVLGISPLLAFESVEDLMALRGAARAAGAEGLMLKRADAPYGIGRVRGPWWKYKIDPLTLDAVLLYAQAGTGRRANLFTDLTLGLRDGDELVTFAKAYSGLSDEEFGRLTRWIRANTVERHGPVRRVPPTQVFELAFEGIWENARRKSGLGVRFPRIVRWREDKPASEADTLDTARALLTPS